MSAHDLDVWMLFLERLGCTLTSLWYQSLNPQTVIEFEAQEVGSGWIFQKRFEFGGSKTQL